MNGLHDALREVFRKAQVVTLLNTGFDHVLISGRLNHTQVIRPLEPSNLARHAHAPGQHCQQFVVTIVNLLTQQDQLIIKRRSRSHNQVFQHIF